MQNKTKRRIHSCTCESCQLHPYGKTAKQHQAINRVLLELNERNKRRFIGVLANQRGRGGTSQLAKITGLSRTTIARGRSEIEHSNKGESSGIRRSGAGRSLVEKNNRAS
jgi:hypothetical protein